MLFSAPEKYIRWIVCLMILFCVSASNAESPRQEIRHYIETKGAQEKKVLWSLSRSNGFELSYRSGEEEHITRTDQQGHTFSWSMKNNITGCSLQAVRKKNTITLAGTCKDHNGEWHLKVDQAPWFQATSLSLKDFVLSKEKEIRFWTLYPDHLKAYKLKAVKVGREMLTIDSKPVETVKVQLSLPGLLSPFWKSHYWYDAKDGKFLRFEGPSELTGNTRITVASVESDETSP